MRRQSQSVDSVDSERIPKFFLWKQGGEVRRPPAGHGIGDEPLANVPGGLYNQRRRKRYTRTIPP